ncbi:uncharacterized protein LOC134210331 [Armigeres subalbatus]|uniref:uncharacterized protein LOC134210331 n=1 Tax=Armigeres subalbatus TaxID=124917 RepID=UPI002ED14105
MRYGRPSTLIRVMTGRIHQLPSPKTNDLNSIIEFGLAVDSLVEHLRNSEQVSHLSNPALLHDLVSKLPVDYRLKWAAFKSSLPEPNLTAFGKFMSTMVELAYEVADDFLPERVNKVRAKDRVFVQAHSESPSPSSRQTPVNQASIARKTCVACNEEGHRIVDCSKFKQMGIDERYKNHANNFVRKWMPGKRLRVYRRGSQLTLLEDIVARQLGIDGPTEPLNLQWTGNIKRNESKSRRITMEVSGSGSSKRFELSDARTVSSLLLPSQSMHYGDLARRYPYLRGLPLQEYSNASPKILIGLDNLKLIVPLKIREGGWKDPIAAKSRLGWSIYGCSLVPTSSVICGFHFGGWTDPDRELNELVRDFFTLENAGVISPPLVLESEEEKRAKMLLETTTRRVSSGFETGLLWKVDKVKFPDSRGMATRRLRALESRLIKEPELYDNVRLQIQIYLEKGYVHVASKQELDMPPDQVWYLPLGVHKNSKKPNKIRLTWDGRASVQGVSFNSMLLKGPDMLSSLPSILCHFRLYRYALTADIREMFHRIHIREEDRQFQRFLWRNHVNQDPEVSPCSAQYVKNLNASEFADTYPRAVYAIHHYHYVDDYLDSFRSREEAIKVGKEVRMIQREGGFELRDFRSNDALIIASVGADSEEIDKKLLLDKLANIESVLGMRWIPNSDCFTYDLAIRGDLLDIINKNHIPTKREVLKVIMSLFDPLGLVAFYLVHGKVLMQDIWTSGAHWDDNINQQLHERWIQWTKILPQLSAIRIPRYYFPKAESEAYSSLQVHIFVDASESAYSCVAYFRVLSPNGPLVSLVGAKTKVAPLKMLSIPRLELQAAVLGTRMLNNVISMHGLQVSQRILWTDSATVLAWLHSEQRRYHQYVGFRIGEILSTTELGEWRWIPSKLNVADDATKWGSGPQIDVNSRWFVGPKFLYQSEERWPQKGKLSFSTEEELRSCNVHLPAVSKLVDVSRFSRWERLLRAIAYVHRFTSNIRRSQRGEPLERGPLMQQELQSAEGTLWQQAQRAFYGEEIHVLRISSGRPDALHASISKSSSIYKLWPFVDNNGILRKRSRLASAPWIPDGVKYPVILPRQHLISILLTDWFHRKFRHANRETIVNEMRQRYEIPKLRSLIARVFRNCMKCRVLRAVPLSPPMSPLPKVRLMPYIRPFTFVGLDFFGPLLVKVGRSNAKRWVALFTCLTIRAVHLEIVHSLTTEACVMAIRRFVSRRGSPSEIYSDNGTNFHGANRQLQEEIEERKNRLATVFTNSTTRWMFNPPGAPHMGGVWERMVRSVKVAVGTILETQRRPDDEVLETVMIEAEAMINSRPLTYIPLESSDQEALTPNHFLLGSSNGVKQLSAEPVDFRSTLRSGWKLAQHLADGIWRRWIKEYLPVISRRSKWFEEVRGLVEGDLVFVVDGAVRSQWVRGKVIRVVCGPRRTCTPSLGADYKWNTSPACR